MERLAFLREASAAKSEQRTSKFAGWALANLALSIAAQAAIEIVRTKVLGMRSALKVSMRLPMPWEIVKDLFRGLCGREVSDRSSFWMDKLCSLKLTHYATL